jgi:hypothetical protein
VARAGPKRVRREPARIHDEPGARAGSMRVFERMDPMLLILDVLSYLAIGLLSIPGIFSFFIDSLSGLGGRL